LAVLLCTPVVAACGDDSGGTTDTDTSTGTAGSTTEAWTTLDTGTAQSSTTTASDTTTDTGDTEDTPSVRCPDEPRRARDQPLIDDLEDGNIQIPEFDGRMGGWYIYDDGTGGRQQPSPLRVTTESAAVGTTAIRTYGEGFTSWGAAIGLAFTISELDYGNCPYDASAYDGVSFWARGSGTIRFHISTMDTATVEEGGRCTGEKCWDDYGIELALEDEWQHFVVRWEDLARGGWGVDSEFDPRELLLMHWQQEHALEFDTWVDDLRFYRAPDDETGTGSTGDASETGDGSTGDSDPSGSTGDGSTGDGSTGDATDGGSTGAAEGSSSDGSTGAAEGSSSDGSTGAVEESESGTVLPR